MKAKVKYSSGLMLIISAYNNHPMLLLEWLAGRQVNTLHKVIRDVDNGELKIRMNTSSREDFNSCAEYINANS